MTEVGFGHYKVTAKFGPRGGTLTHVDKTKGFTNYSNALEIFIKTESEKRAKGYKDILNPRQALINRLKQSTPTSYLLPSEWGKIAKTVEEIIEEHA